MGIKELTIIIIFLGIIFSLVFTKLFIPILKHLKFGQEIRKEGPKKHLIKKGTPTMGGITIIITAVIIYFAFYKFIIAPSSDDQFSISKCILLIAPFIGYGIIGFIDDFLIVYYKNNKGLSARAKFFMQLLLAGVIYIFILDSGFDNSINFFGKDINLGFFFGVLIIFMFALFTNGTNLTDGLDGLLSLNVLINFGGFAVIALLNGDYEVLFFALSIIISLIAFLYFNLPKAKLFMGDTGSMALGAALVVCSIILKYEILLFFMGIVYLIEIASVVLQVWYFKKTKGKRLLKMSPFHHHLELCGLAEIEIDLIFMGITLVSTAIAVYLGVKVF